MLVNLLVNPRHLPQVSLVLRDRTVLYKLLINLEPPFEYAGVFSWNKVKTPNVIRSYMIHGPRPNSRNVYNRISSEY